MDLDTLQAFGSAYADAWCSQKPESVAEFFAENGSLTVNAGPPAAGRQAIADIARGFMIAFPDMNVSLDDVVPDGDGAVFHWTLTGTNSGPAGAGRRVRISGRELWRFDSRGLIAHSTGQFDHAEYERQLQFGVDDLSALTARRLAAHYNRVRGKIQVLVEPLSTEQLWTRPFPFGNSVGHLLLHLTGNLNYYIGTQIAGTGYVRDRPLEFADTSHRSKDEVVRDFNRAVELVIESLMTQREADWHAPYSAVGAEDITDRLGMFLRCAAHADHHAGQMIYLCKELGES
jgi:predicted ester cyclase/uncharacterized damage-inducible protein DinB